MIGIFSRIGEGVHTYFTRIEISLEHMPWLVHFIIIICLRIHWSEFFLVVGIHFFIPLIVRQGT